MASEEPVQKPQNFTRVLVRMTAVLWRPEMRRWRFRIVVALILTLVAKGLAVAAPVYMGDGINRVTDGAANGAAPAFALALFLFGGEVLEGFAFTMLVGTLATTYSGWFIAPSIAIMMSGRASGAAAEREQAPQQPARKAKPQRKAKAS